jgi:hypothetical protein
MQETELKVPGQHNVESEQYEAPGVESVMTAEDMEREVAYAGTTLPSEVTT